MRVATSPNFISSLNMALTGSGRSLLEQALYPKTAYGRTLGPLAFGGLYSAGTYIGFPKNWAPKELKEKVQFISLDNSMYGYPRRRTRKIRVWSKRYRRYVWVYPRY